MPRKLFSSPIYAVSSANNNSHKIKFEPRIRNSGRGALCPTNDGLERRGGGASLPPPAPICLTDSPALPLCPNPLLPVFPHHLHTQERSCPCCPSLLHITLCFRHCNSPTKLIRPEMAQSPIPPPNPTHTHPYTPHQHTRTPTPTYIRRQTTPSFFYTAAQAPGR